jgi:TatD DNase family protein
MIDSHCHIDGTEFDADRADVLARARAAGVNKLVVVGTGPSIEQIERAVRMAETEPDVWAVVGVHPHDAAKIEDAWWPRLEELARHPRVVAVGETGLDFYYDSSPREAQRAAFHAHVELARRVGKPVVCHVRGGSLGSAEGGGGAPLIDAHAETVEILRGSGVPGVIHCFTGGPDEAAAYVELGLCISFSGIVTFKNAEAIRAAVPIVPRDRILVETDAPYLAPVPMRGKRNEPAFLPHTIEVVARCAAVTPAELVAVTVANTSRLFRLTP